MELERERERSERLRRYLRERVAANRRLQGRLLELSSQNRQQARAISMLVETIRKIKDEG